jgi:hypothetical protein
MIDRCKPPVPICGSSSIPVRKRAQAGLCNLGRTEGPPYAGRSSLTVVKLNSSGGSEPGVGNPGEDVRVGLLSMASEYGVLPPYTVAIGCLQ